MLLYYVIFGVKQSVFCIRSAGQPQIGPHFIWNRDE